MTLNNIETNSYCLGGRHLSATRNIYGNVASKGIKFYLVIVQFAIEKNL